MSIHPTAIIDPSSEIDPSCEIGPYTVIGANVKIGKNNRIDSHCVFEGPTEIGEGNHFYPSVMIGLDPQSTGFKGEKSVVYIGNNNVVREMVQIHRSIYEGGKTIVGNNNFLMGNVHIAHDCIVGNYVIMANGATLAGHVEIGDRAFLSGFVTAAQFLRVGTTAIVSIHTRIVKDIPPYVIAMGDSGYHYGLNVVGMRRAGIDAASRQKVKDAYRLYFRSGLSIRQAHELAPQKLDMDNVYVATFIKYIKESKKGVSAAGSKRKGTVQNSVDEES